MTVHSFDPKSAKTEVSDADLARLLAGAGRLDTDDFGFSAPDVAELAALARHPDVDWEARGDSLSDDDAIALIRLFTLAEGTFPSWQAGAKSPVVPLAATLKRRGAYPEDLTGWIKANTENRFLPYGSLLDRM
jgi:hypothetical protein